MKAYVLETIIMVNRNRPVKKTYQLIILCQPKARLRQLGAPSLWHAAGQVPMIQAFQFLQNKLGEKIVSCLNCQSMMTGKQMLHQKLLTHIFVERTLADWMERKHKWEMLMMISDATWWGYWRLNHCLHKIWKLSSWPSQSYLKWTMRGNRWVTCFFKMMKVGK